MAILKVCYKEYYGRTKIMLYSHAKDMEERPEKKSFDMTLAGPGFRKKKNVVSNKAITRQISVLVGRKTN